MLENQTLRTFWHLFGVVLTFDDEDEQGGQLVWVAPSGGRDRPTEEGSWQPNAYDPENVSVFYKLGKSARVPVHYYGMAMHTGEMMPPPPTLQKSIGERRQTFFVPVGTTSPFIFHLQRISEVFSF
jgi:hypothetical protein